MSRPVLPGVPPVSVFVVLVVVLAGALSLAVDGATGGADGTLTAASASAPPLALLNPTAPQEANNSSVVRHRNPDEVEDAGNLSAVEAYLVGRMASMLSESSASVRRGEYDQARELLGDPYNDSLSRYAEVADQRSGGETVDPFREARDHQRAFASTVRAYHETREAYEEARASGDDTRARERARELDRLATRVNRTESRLARFYEGIEGTTGADLSEARVRVSETTRDVTTDRDEVRDSVFVATRLEATTDGSELSFLDSTTVRGRLVDANETPVADRRVRLRVGERTLTALTDEDGRFSVAYRPVSLPVSTTRLTVAYRPHPDSVYLDSTATLAVDVRQVTPSLSLDDVPARVRYADPVRVTGRVSVERLGVVDAPVVLTVDGRRIATGRTDADGRFSLDGSLPASIPAGERTLAVRIAHDDRAIGPAVATRTVRVARTGTAVRLEARGTDSRSIRAVGRLTTADGEPVVGERVRLRAASDPAQTVRTDAVGRFDATLTVPGDAAVDGDSRVRVVAVYGGSENLAGTRANVTTRVADVAGPTADSGGLFGPPWLWVGAAGLGLLLGGGALLRLRAVRDRRRSTGDASAAESPEAPRTVDDETRAFDRVEPLAPARDALAAGDFDRAVTSAYAAVRRRLVERLGRPVFGLTHREFVQACRSAGVADFETLDAVTRGYERATFDPAGVSEETATDVLAAADRLLDVES